MISVRFPNFFAPVDTNLAALKMSKAGSRSYPNECDLRHEECQLQEKLK